MALFPFVTPDTRGVSSEQILPSATKSPRGAVRVSNNSVTGGSVILVLLRGSRQRKKRRKVTVSGKKIVFQTIRVTIVDRVGRS